MGGVQPGRGATRVGHTAPLRRALTLDSHNLGILQCPGLSRDADGVSLNHGLCSWTAEQIMWKAEDFSLGLILLLIFFYLEAEQAMSGMLTQ